MSKKISSLPMKSTLSDTDLIPIVDMDSTPTTKNITVSTLIAAIPANGGSGAPTGAAGGNLSGTYPNPIVAKINGATVPASGSLVTGNALKVSGIGALSYSAINLAGGTGHVSGVLPEANQADQTMNGDVSGSTSSAMVIGLQGIPVSTTAPTDAFVLTYNGGTGTWEPRITLTGGGGGGGSPTGVAGGHLGGTYPNPTVIKANGATIPVAGSLTTGNLLQVSGSSALTYAALNLAGGTGYITGILPTANQANQTLGGDLSGATNSAAVISLTGASGTLPIAATAGVLQWNLSTTNPTLKQADNTAGSATGRPLFIQAQNTTGATSTGGNLLLSAGAGTTANGTVRICDPTGNNAIQFTPVPAGATSITFVAGITGVNFNQTSSTSANGAPMIFSAQSASSTFTGGAIGLSAGLATGTGTGGSVNISAGTGTVGNGSINFRTNTTTFFSYPAPNATGTVSAQYVSTITALNFLQASTSTANGAALTIGAQSSTFTGSTGGNLVLKSGVGATAAGNVVLQSGATPLLTLTPTQLTLATTKTVESTAAHGQFDTELKELTTTTGTTADIFDYTIPDLSHSIVDVVIVANQSGGSVGDAWKGTVTVHRSGSTVTLSTPTITHFGSTAWTITLDNNSTTGRVRVTGALTTTIFWSCTVRIQTTV